MATYNWDTVREIAHSALSMDKENIERQMSSHNRIVAALAAADDGNADAQEFIADHFAGDAIVYVTGEWPEMNSRITEFFS